MTPVRLRRALIKVLGTGFGNDPMIGVKWT